MEKRDGDNIKDNKEKKDISFKGITANKDDFISIKPKQEMPKKQQEKQQEKQELLKSSEISLWIDTYDDVFSDFDPRQYSERAISIDFLDEAKRASRDMVSGQIELNILAPNSIRNAESENNIKKRLKDHFKRHFSQLKKEKAKIEGRGIIFIIVGIALMVIATFILFKFEKTALTSFLTILLEPASWFLMWEGMNMVIFKSKTEDPSLNFYRKMSKCQINFLSY